MIKVFVSCLSKSKNIYPGWILVSFFYDFLLYERENISALKNSGKNGHSSISFLFYLIMLCIMQEPFYFIVMLILFWHLAMLFCRFPHIFVKFFIFLQTISLLAGSFKIVFDLFSSTFLLVQFKRKDTIQRIFTDNKETKGGTCALCRKYPLPVTVI